MFLLRVSMELNILAPPEDFFLLLELVYETFPLTDSWTEG